MLEAFRLGGWGMFPTLFFGVLFVTVAIGYARNPERARRVLLSVLSLLTLAAGGLGFVTGAIVTLTYAAGTPNQDAVIAMGISESLHNIALALILVVLGGIATAVGAWRAQQQQQKP
ncbi:hypothetical protein [Polyangium aurulentum]|uniref:hypothetical protein n=1 Tax=Polyangium aurulentum TaxID=2567896 RepID=UPI0010AE7616|nr:hypothetical protein [Polyangium aurulentum]UQA60092.1 hypothetical protein E8A73_006300 [Polyangium aurulentum]